MFVTTPERSLLETLFYKGGMHPFTLRQEVDLNLRLVMNMINRLKKIGLITQEGTTVQLEKNNDQAWNLINSPRNRQHETREILETLLQLALQGQRKSSFHLKKVWMNEEERKSFFNMLLCLEIFFKQLKQKEQKGVGQQQVVIWGYAQYGDILKTLLTH